MGERRLRPGARRAVALAVAIAAIGGIAYASTYSWVFRADRVDVQGGVRLTDEEIRALARVQVGTNLVHLDTGAATSRLLADPRIASATVETDLPDVVTLRIVERVPVASTEIDGVTVVVADDGVILPGATPSGIPVLRTVGGVLDERRRVEAAAALGAMTPSVRRGVATVYSGVDGALTLERADGVTVTYGPAQEVAAKAEALRAVLAWAAGQEVELTAIDLTVPSAPTVRTTTGTVTPG